MRVSLWYDLPLTVLEEPMRSCWKGGSLVSAETPLVIKEPDLLLQLPSEKLYFLFEVL